MMLGKTFFEEDTVKIRAEKNAILEWLEPFRATGSSTTRATGSSITRAIIDLLELLEQYKITI